MGVIRQAEQKDISRIAEILIFTKRMNYRSIFQNDDVSFGVMQVVPLAEALDKNKELLQSYWVYDDGFVKGLIHIQEERIEELYVDSFFEGRGIGGKLIDFAIRDKEITFLWVLEKNLRAISFYEKHGFQRTEERKLEEGTTEYIVKMKQTASSYAETVEECLVCNRIEQTKRGENPYFVKELETGYVVLGDIQRFPGYTLFLCKKHATELHFLEKEYRKKYLEEMAIVAEAVYHAFHPDKLNYELLGVGQAQHMHWHIFPRVDGDTPQIGPVWRLDKSEMNDEKYRPSKEELHSMKEKLRTELDKLL